MNHDPSFQQVKAIMEAQPVPVSESSQGIGVSSLSPSPCTITQRVPQEPTVEEEAEYENLMSWWMKRKELEAYD